MGDYTGPVDPALRRAWTQARRSTVRSHHPDVGGDAEALREELRRVDTQFRQLDGLDRRPGRWQPVGRIVRRAGRRSTTVVRGARARLPSGWPGARRYLDL